MKECKHVLRCGGCSGVSHNIEDELTNKRHVVCEKFRQVVNDDIVDKCVGGYYPYKYRNKVHLAFGELKGKTLIGFFEENSTKITDINECCLFGDWLSILTKVLREYVSRFKIRPFNRNGGGVIRYAHARCIDNKVQLTLVVTTENFGGRDWLYNELCKHFAEVSLYVNINNRSDRVVLDKKLKFVKGSKYLNFDVCGVKVSISPSSFLQVNLPIAEKMYKKALEMLDINDNTTVVDLYSGVGITSIIFAKKSKKVVSIEEVDSAVSNAKAMAKLNGVNNVVHLLGKCENEIARITQEEDVVVFVDPARAGLDDRVINAILLFNPRKIVYMSCSIDSCVNDITKIVADRKYRVVGIKPYNMFPFTEHVELLVELVRL